MNLMKRNTETGIALAVLAAVFAQGAEGSDFFAKETLTARFTLEAPAMTEIGGDYEDGVLEDSEDEEFEEEETEDTGKSGEYGETGRYDDSADEPATVLRQDESGMFTAVDGDVNKGIMNLISRDIIEMINDYDTVEIELHGAAAADDGEELEESSIRYIIMR